MSRRVSEVPILSSVLVHVQCTMYVHKTVYTCTCVHVYLYVNVCIFVVLEGLFLSPTIYIVLYLSWLPPSLPPFHTQSFTSVPDFSRPEAWDHDRLKEYIPTITYEAESPDEAALVEVRTLRITDRYSGSTQHTYVHFT